MKRIMGILVLVALVIVPSLATDSGGPAVTLGAGGDLVYSPGDIILFSGTNTVGPATYLFVVGPGLPEGGVRLSDLSIPAETGNVSTFMEVLVEPDTIFSAEWNPASAAPGGTPAGSYTVFASSAPVNFSDLADTPFDSVTIFLLGWPSAVPFPTAPLPVTVPPTQPPVTIPPTQVPFPVPTASSPSGTPVTIPPTQNPQTNPPMPSPADPLVTVLPTQTPVPLPTTPAPTEPPVSIPPTQAPFPVPTASSPSGTPVTIPPTQTPVPLPTPPAQITIPPTQPSVTIPPTQAPFPVPTASSPSGTPVTNPPTQTPIPLPTPPLPFPLPTAPSGSGSIWQFAIGSDGFDSWSDWLFDQLKDFLIP
jgi:hypothetical protein